jgi:hypothetical protein
LQLRKKSLMNRTVLVDREAGQVLTVAILPVLIAVGNSSHLADCRSQ